MKLNTIIIEENVLAVDIIAASLLGYSIDEVWHLNIASQSGLGPKKGEDIKVYNPLLNLLKREKIVSVSWNKRLENKLSELEIIEKGTCSSCKGALLVATHRLSREGYSPSCTVVMGQLASEQMVELDKAKRNGIPIIGVGRCGTKVVQDCAAENIKDCPVRAEQIYGILKKFTQK